MPRRKTKRAAFYLRVSTSGQTTDSQRHDVEQLAAHRGYEVVHVFEETVSARAKKRPAYDEMMAAAHRGEFDVLVVWALDRFGRSLAKNVEAVVALDEKHVEVVSVREPWLDTAGPTRGLLVSIFSWVAEQESERISERVRAGQARAKREGTHIGRPRAKLNRDRARELRAKGLSIREIAKKMKASRATVHRVLQDTPEYRAEVAS